MNKLFRTNESVAGLILRVALGVVMFPHGAQKLLGWFGGPGYGPAMAMFTDKMHIPAALAVPPRPACHERGRAAADAPAVIGHRYRDDSDKGLRC